MTLRARVTCWLVGHRWGRVTSHVRHPYDRLVTEVVSLSVCSRCERCVRAQCDVTWDHQVQDEFAGWSVEGARESTAALVTSRVWSMRGPAWLPRFAR